MANSEGRRSSGRRADSALAIRVPLIRQERPMADVTLENVRKVYAGAVEAVKGVSLDIDGRLVLRAGRALRLRQVHPAAHDRRARDHHRAARSASAARRQRDRAGRARHRHGVPELRALPAHERLRQHGLRPEEPRHAEGRDRGAGQGSGTHPRDRAVPGAQAARALRRPAPARRHGPRHRARSRRCSCSTSRCPTSTPSCACRCASRSSACSARSA